MNGHPPAFVQELYEKTDTIDFPFLNTDDMITSCFYWFSFPATLHFSFYKLDWLA